MTHKRRLSTGDKEQRDRSLRVRQPAEPLQSHAAFMADTRAIASAALEASRTPDTANQSNTRTPSQFTVQIDTSNDAFLDETELPRILRDLARVFGNEAYQFNEDGAESFTYMIRDSSGNIVGKATRTAPERERR